MCTHAHSTRDTFFHCSTKRDPSFKLKSNILSNELRIEIRAAHFMNVEIDFSVGKFGKFGFELLDFRTFFANHNSWTRSVDINLRFIRSPFNLNFCNTSMLQSFLDKIADTNIVVQKMRHTLFPQTIAIPILQ